MPPTAATYDTIGHDYRKNRAADPRIVEMLLRLMVPSPGATICDVGAGSGNYANAIADAGYSVLAVEPSKVMRAQADSHPRVTWIDGVAERMPIADASAQAVMCVLAVHHFRSLIETVAEMHRVCPNGPLVWLTLDPRTAADIWFNAYFPEIVAAGYSIFPPLADVFAEVKAATGRRGEAFSFPLPKDLRDRFLHATWNAPEAYFDPTLRSNHSGFAKAEPTSVERGLSKLRTDLESGAWDRRHGHLRTQESFDAGYQFVAFRV